MRTPALICSLIAVMWSFIALPAGAQESVRTIEHYNKEAGVQYVAAWENDDRWGNGVLLQGGYGLDICSYWGWRCQGIAELTVVRFDYFDASFKQFALGVRYSRMMWPKIRTYAQLQGGIQNDGFPNDSNGSVVAPGVGINYALTRRFDVQVLLDFPITFYPKGTYNQARLGIGVGIPLSLN